MEHEADGYKYVYQFKDHLGNIRLSYKDADKDGTITTSEIVEVKDYYPFGMQLNYGADHPNSRVNGRKHNYGFNGVELEENLGLDLYEMDLRKYDPAIARFNGIDPVTHYEFSTYNAFDNNPVFWSDPSGADGEHYNWDTGRYEDDQGNEVSFETALASVSSPNDHIKINTKTKKAEVFADDNDYDTIETDGVLSYSPNGKTRSRLESEGYSIRDIEGVGMGAFDNAVLILSSEAVFAWALRGIKGIWAAWAARGTTVTAKSSSNFLKLLKPLDEFDEAVTLFRGTTGSEASSASIFLTDNAAVAATYIKNGGQVASYRVSQFAIKQLEQSGALNLLKGIHNTTGQISTEYQFIGKELVKAINQLAK